MEGRSKGRTDSARLKEEKESHSWPRQQKISSRSDRGNFPETPLRITPSVKMHSSFCQNNMKETTKSSFDSKWRIDFKAFEHSSSKHNTTQPPCIPLIVPNVYVSVLPTRRFIFQLSTIASRGDDMRMFVSLDTSVFEVAEVWVFR
jgi:hypothetical protein